MIKKQQGSRFLLVVLLSLLSACFGSNNETVLDGSPFSDDPSQPFTNAYIEYPGPHRKWAGPQTFVIHLNAEGKQKAKVSIPTGIFTSGGHSLKDVHSSSHGLTIEAAREEMARLNTALKAKETPVHGCLSPVRVKLVRADKAIISRLGCRGQMGWPRVASEMVNHLIQSSIN